MMFQTYERLPKKVEAVQFTEKIKYKMIKAFLKNTSFCHEEGGRVAIVVTTIHGDEAFARVGDWIVKEEEEGYYYPVKDDIFRKGYVKK